ncbi:MAG: extensin family protein [Alphaproteobacteria bacterium]|nr:extensin family protein [Alphaproteobacteria bacterium]
MLQRKATFRSRQGAVDMRGRINPALLIIGLVAALMLLAVARQLGLVTLPPHYDPFSPPDLRERPYWLTSTKLLVLDNDPAACSAALAQAGLNGILLPPANQGRACHLDATVMLSRLSGAAIRQEQTRCSIAARMYLWDRFVLQPAALRHYGQRASEVLHFGSYNCRTIHNSSHMSEHATANAFDIAGVRLAGGRVISVKKAWTAGGTDAAFLRELRDGACGDFNMTLSPDYNADHADHLHVDMGWLHGCH